MKVSYNWLQTHFDKQLPKAKEISNLFTMHAFEVEGIEETGNDFVFDFKVLPNRAHDCLCHDGVARELSVLGKLPLKTKEKNEKWNTQKTNHSLKITIENPNLCRRYSGRIIEDIKIGPSPIWLKERLEAIGQRSINNIVDITNYVMFETGQPLHAFDLDKLAKSDGSVEIIVRTAESGEKLVTLDGKDIKLDETMLLIADKEKPLALAGIKGGKWAEVDLGTKNIIIESANFEPTSTRRTSVKVGLKTDSQKRFENEITPELTERGIEMASKMVGELASSPQTKIGEVVDVYPKKRKPYKIGVSVPEINKLLGSKMTEKEVEKILKQLNFEYEVVDDPIAYICKLAPRYLGVPYKYGASISYEAPEVFDCSGFTSFLYSEAGVEIPRMAVDQLFFGEEVSVDNLLPGDLVFSNTGDGKIFFESIEFLPGSKIEGGVDHVGIYVGEGKIIHDTRHKGMVVFENMVESEQFKKIVGCRRILHGKEKRFVVTVPKERMDMVSKRGFMISGNTEDLIEEIGRVHGYEDIPSIAPDKPKIKPETNKTFHYANIVKKTLKDLGFSEVSTYALVSGGEIELRNPMSEDKRYLRSSLSQNLEKAFALNSSQLPLLGMHHISEEKIFEIGKIFLKDSEYTACALIANNTSITEEAKKALEERLGEKINEKIKNNVWEFNFDELVSRLPAPEEYELPESPEVTFKSISTYPFVLRDIAIFVPKAVFSERVVSIIKERGGDLLTRVDIFDTFKKEDEVSYAYHLVFQSYEKTLSDEEVNKIMDKVISKLNSQTDWKVR